ncbi:aldehyde dehydrogenase (NAD+) [Filimonas lacunae]|uniref:Aldehyde dehydrogenase n=1 Tax=Filimonas lacunae TaxID=477680 RepID=A0A173MQG1_9BACT|nr:aldehyde dehydrogenase [Filimonas lacunae]BAV09903.1 aldehyde dehydrogenase [Filimonas lacunae]SIS80781.1 aldehyde dehydrogenase (NAD+) [Filimonas lacunae]
MQHAFLQPMQQHYTNGATRSYSFRIQQLKKLRNAIQEYETRIIEALYNDLHKSPEEAYTTEIGICYAEIKHILYHLEEWMRPSHVSTPLALFPGKSKVIKDPLGVCLIVAPWNYPFNLMMIPLTGAIAGGNCVVLKPSELAPHTAAVIADMIQAHFAPEFISVVQGEGSTVVHSLLQEFRFHHIFFTGSIPVGKAVAQQAAAQLIPVTLELGGKSPCIVDETANITTAAARIVWGKFTNAGQTCVAPDYLLVHQSKKEALIQAMTAAIQKYYGTDPLQSYDYGRIINTKRFDTLQEYLKQGQIVTGGQTNRNSLYIAPTILDHVATTAPVMQEEIFGPLLPVYTYQHREEALAFIQQHPNPLSLYVFSSNREAQTYFTENIAFGGGCINNTLMHLGNPYLPFGGVATSGMGQYHGKYSFDIFTRPKAILTSAIWPDPSVKYPPYKGKLKLLKWLLK